MTAAAVHRYPDEPCPPVFLAGEGGGLFGVFEKYVLEDVVRVRRIAHVSVRQAIHHVRVGADDLFKLFHSPTSFHL